MLLLIVWMQFTFLKLFMVFKKIKITKLPPVLIMLIIEGKYTWQSAWISQTRWLTSNLSIYTYKIIASIFYIKFLKKIKVEFIYFRRNPKKITSYIIKKKKRIIYPKVEKKTQKGKCTLLIRWGELKRHLALHRGSLRSAPWRSSSVARPPSRTAEPPQRRRKFVIIEEGWSTLFRTIFGRILLIRSAVVKRWSAVAFSFNWENYKLIENEIAYTIYREVLYNFIPIDVT